MTEHREVNGRCERDGKPWPCTAAMAGGPPRVNVPPERIAGTFVALMHLLHDEELEDALRHAQLHDPTAVSPGEHDFAVARCQVECELETT